MSPVDTPTYPCAICGETAKPALADAHLGMICRDCAPHVAHAGQLLKSLRIRIEPKGLQP